MAGILSKGPVAQEAYQHQECMTTVIFGVDDPITAVAYPLLMAYDRDIYVDEVVFRANNTGDATTTATLRRAASGTSGDGGGDAFSAALTTSGVADHTNSAFTLVAADSTLARARVVPKGSTLFCDVSATAGNGAGWAIYIRWRTNPTG